MMHIRNFRLELKRIISVPEIRQVIISNLILHPAGKRLLIQTRDSILRMMDLNTTAIIQWFRVSIYYLHLTRFIFVMININVNFDRAV